MGKIEKTLELNISHEIVSLAETFQWKLAPVYLRRHWNPILRKGGIIPPIPYMLGLPLTEEGKKGGWDVSIVSPAIGKRPPRILYIQYKAGKRKEFCTISNSKFKGDKKHPNPCVEFEFGKKNQHKLLQDLSKSMRRTDAVMYAFPRIVDVENMLENLGKLLFKTTFVSIKKIDEEAKAKNINLADGHIHKFRACFNDERKYEVNLILLPLEQDYDFTEIVSEIIAIRVMRTFDAIQDSLTDQNDFIYSYNIAHAFAMTLESYMNYLELDSVEYLSNLLGEYPRINKYFNKINSKIKNDDTPNSAMKYKFLNLIVEKLSPYFNLTKTARFDRNITVPAAPANFTHELFENSQTLLFDESYNIESFENLSYSVF